MNRHLQKLMDTAVYSGASAVHLFKPRDIVVEEELAGYCASPECVNYGLAASCPPHVGGPALFRQWRDGAGHAMAIRIDAPSRVLLSEERTEVMRLLHHVVAAVEFEARSFTYVHSRGFAGGSCKKIFCSDQPSCLLLSEEGICRHPLYARPSMSGFGVNVGEMMRTAGWDVTPLEEKDKESEAMSWVAGLVLIAK